MALRPFYKSRHHVVAFSTVVACLFCGSFSAAALSSIDQKFKLSRHFHPEAQSPNEMARAYRGVFAKSMFSKCHWFPSDSEFLILKSKECGSLRGTLLAFARFMTEPEASRLGLGPIYEGHRLRFVDWGNACETF